MLFLHDAAPVKYPLESDKLQTSNAFAAAQAAREEVKTEIPVPLDKVIPGLRMQYKKNMQIFLDEAKANKTRRIFH